MNLPPYELIETQSQWQVCLTQLQKEPRLAIDLEANSMHAYREQVCLIQISIPTQDYLLDPLQSINLEGLGKIIASPQVEKVFHAAEYDLMLLKRQYNWEIKNLFDTMWAARILGHKRYGLASILKATYDIDLDKRFQKSNWCKRPLSAEQRLYAQLDTHYLLRLRDHLAAKIKKTGHEAEMAEIFEQQSRVKISDNAFDPNSFWSINGVHDLTPPQQAILRALAIYRDQEAEARNQPLFKIFSDRTLIELARVAPTQPSKLSSIHGMTSRQVRRYGQQLLHTIAQARHDPHPKQPKRPKRPPEAVVNRYEQLHYWRKTRAKQRGVDSDVIVSRNALWSLARANPQTLADLATIQDMGEWQQKTYGPEILRLLKQPMRNHRYTRSTNRNRKSKS